MPDEPDYSDTLKFALSLRDDEDDLVLLQLRRAGGEHGRLGKTSQLS